jgi:hypothetical protein
MRRAVRRARRRSGAAKPLGETLQDVYITLFAVAMLAAIVGPSTARVLRDVEERAASPTLAATMVAATLLAAAGAVLGALLLVGPVVRDPADVTWLLSSPVRRRGLLAPVVLVLLAAGTVIGAVVTLGASVLVPGAHVAVWLAAGAAGGLALVSVAVVAQPRRRLRVAARRTATALTAAALVVLVVGLASNRSLRFAAPGDAAWLLLPMGVLAFVMLLLVPAALDRLRRPELTAGAGLALGLRATVTTLDGSFVAETMRARRLLEHGLVRRHALAGRAWVPLVVADARRVLRSPRSLAAPLGLVPVAWMVGRLYGDVAVTAAVVLVGWATAGSTCAGLRTVARSPGVARSLPFPDSVLRGAHCVVPAAAALAVTLATCALGGQPLWVAAAATACGIAGVLRTSGGRRPVKWELQAASPMGAMPVGAVMSYVVGIDVVALTSIPLLASWDPFVCLAVPVAVALLLARQRRRKD